MAFGYARASGKVGAYAVVPGPGLLNTTAALATAYATNAPVLCISGQIPSDLIGRGFGLLHEIPDQLGILQAADQMGGADRPPDADRQARQRGVPPAARRPAAPGRARNAARRAWRWRPRWRCRRPTRRRPPPAPDPELIDQAAALLADAKKPLLFVGSGAVDAAEEVLAIAEMLQAPVVSYTGGKGIVSDRHYLAQSAARRPRAVARHRCRAGGRHPAATSRRCAGGSTAT